MKLCCLTALLLSALMPAQPQRPRVSRASLAKLEKTFDVRISKPAQADPYDLLGNTRAVYLEGYGVVFSTELNLVFTPMSPFRPALTKDDIDNLRRKKLTKLDALKQTMREMMILSAAELGGVAPDERVVAAVTLFYYSWEQRAGLPSQIVMQAPRAALLKGDGPELGAVLRVEEF